MKRILYLTIALLLVLAASALAEEAPSVAVTQWTESMELFMEHPVLVAGQDGRFIIHLTILDGFQPIRAGEVTLTFRDRSGVEQHLVSDELLREGIFVPTVQLANAGAYDFELNYRGPGAGSTFVIGDFVVYASLDAIPDQDEDDAGQIGFLKEQQWKIPFKTTAAEHREIKQGSWAIGEVMPAPAAYVEIVAPVDGMVQVDGAGSLALPGAQVSRGDVVARIVPPVLGDSWAVSQLALAQAERNFARAKRLQDKDAISAREFEETRNEYLARKAGHERLAGSGNDGVLKLTAPIDGQVIDWQVRPGRRLEAGDKLMTIADPGVVWLKVNVYENDYRTMGTPVGAYVHTDGPEGGWMIPAADLKVLTTGGALDPMTRTIPVLLEINNADGRLTINESTPVELYAGESAMGTAVPRTAVYQDEGLSVVFVQAGGESFAKRIVRVGPLYGDWVTILAGIEPGERVVSRGGYHVKLASTSAEIGHGHAH